MNQNPRVRAGAGLEDIHRYLTEHEGISPTLTSRAGVPSMVAWLTSGYWVEEWLPQMMVFFTLPT